MNLERSRLTAYTRYHKATINVGKGYLLCSKALKISGALYVLFSDSVHMFTLNHIEGARADSYHHPNWNLIEVIDTFHGSEIH